ncbi:hypothetical protein [Elizabethkingia bruuniana]|uniref:hypothetical protein n=1 Tax=Elizabethkingia bruuniana TaxID=1756149 RepID=UPI0020117CBF|nr:hypothetical protein [Elizabethkingia bruuniana]MCL1636284.1 hypothetical protein [Elizabethkingia bruuniana]
MKRLEEIKNEYAKQWYKDWNDLEIDCQFNIGTLIGHTDKVTELYALEVAQASLQKAAENAKTKKVLGVTKRFSGSALVSRTIVDKESITNEYNIVIL